MQYIDWNQLSELGLLERINREILHPLGLAAMRSPTDGSSIGALVSDDGVFEYDKSIKTKAITDKEVIERLSNMERKDLM